MTGDSHKPEIIQNAFCRFENDSPEKGIKRSRSATIVVLRLTMKFSHFLIKVGDFCYAE